MLENEQSEVREEPRTNEELAEKARKTSISKFVSGGLRLPVFRVLRPEFGRYESQYTKCDRNRRKEL